MRADMRQLTVLRIDAVYDFRDRPIKVSQKTTYSNKWEIRIAQIER